MSMIEPSAQAELVAAFANTLDLDDETDFLTTPADAAGWLVAQGLVERPAGLDDRDHRMLLDLRAGIRDALGGVTSADRLAVGDAVLRELPVLVSLGATPALRPAPTLPAPRRAMATLAIAWSHLVSTGEADRLKRCADDTCGWVFWDVSRNHSRRWCTMSVCGNRAKARAYAARQRARGSASASTTNC
jgi:predicted RNA-binding Zn ribbon-like protein